MRAMLFDASGMPLRAAEIPEPVAGDGELMLRVRACGVCRTDLHIIDGELTQPKLPLVLGHMIVADVVGEDRRVGVPWLGWTDGDCRYCCAGLENLCDRAQFTGYDLDGGFAEYTVADERFCFPLPDAYAELDVAPLLCSGLIGYRSLRFTGDAERLGLYGFGASAHIIVQVALHQGRRVFAFTRAGRRRGAGVRARTRRGVGRRIRRSAARRARRRDHLRAGRRARAGGAARRAPRAARSSAPVST